jgi:hypothetical protein
MAAKKPKDVTRDAKRRAPSKTAPKTAKPSAFNGNARADLSAEELRQLISEAAYYRAKQRGFAPGHELEDWVQAEAEVIGRLSGRLNVPGRAA